MSYGKRNKNITKTNKRPKNNFKMKRDTVIKRFTPFTCNFIS